MNHPSHGKIMRNKTTVLNFAIVSDQQFSIPTFVGYLAKGFQPPGKSTGIVNMPHMYYYFAFLAVFHFSCSLKNNITSHSSGQAKAPAADLCVILPL